MEGKPKGLATAIVWCFGVWLLIYFLNILVCKSVLRSDIPSNNTDVSTNLPLLDQFWREKWVDLAMIQHLLGAVLAMVLVKLMGKSICSPAFEHKLVVLIASICNVTGNLAANAAFTMVPSNIAHIVESCQPLVTFVLMMTFYRNKVPQEISSFLSISVLVLGIIAFPIVSTSFTASGLLTAAISMLAYSARNVLVKKLGDVWGDPLQKFLAVSVVSFFLVAPLWYVKVAITCFQSVSMAGIFKFVAAGAPHSLYTIASFKVLESMLSPVSHAILVVLIRLVYYFEEMQVLFSWNIAISILGIILGIYLYRNKKTAPLNFTVFICFMALVSRGLFHNNYYMPNTRPKLYDIPAENLTDNFAIMPFNTSELVDKTPDDSNGISMAWVYAKPVNGTILSNIQTLAEHNQGTTIHVYCGTTQCVGAVTELSLPNVAAEFAMVSDIVKNTPLQQWLARHPLNKLIAGREFEIHLQEVTILGILWKYGGFYVSPMVTVRSRLDNLTESFNCNVSWVSPEQKKDEHLPSVLDIAYFCSYDNFMYELIRAFVLKYPISSDGRDFNFHHSVWKTVKAKCSNELPCPGVFNNTIVTARIATSDLKLYSNFGAPELNSAATPPDELKDLAILQFLPHVHTFLKSRSRDSNVTVFFDSRWGISDGSWPPPNGVNPIMLSLHVVNQTKQKWESGIDFFAQRMPVGCEDTKTRDFMKEHKIDAFLSGSIMLLLNSHNNVTSEDVFVTDLKGDTLKLLPRELNWTVLPLRERKGISNRVEKLWRVLHLKEKFAIAKLVITGSIDHALLCAALQTPVLFIIDANYKTTNTSSQLITELSPLFHTFDLGNTTRNQSMLRLANFFWHDIAPNPNLGMLMRFKATLWDVVRNNQVLYDAAMKFGTVPMLPLAEKHGDSLLFHLIFTTSSESKVRLFSTKKKQSGSFNWRHMRTIESIFLHHPASRIYVHSNTLSQSTFDVLTEVGYSITVQKYDMKQLLKGSPAEVFISKIETTSKGVNWYSHATDLMRLLVLYKWGGVYMDTDMILVRSLTSMKKNTLGFQNRANTETNGALMMFEKNNTYIRACLVQFANHYRTGWAGNGPALLTSVWKKMKDSNEVHAVSYKHFYMISYKVVQKQCFEETAGEAFTTNMEILKSEAYAVHLNSKITGNLGLGENRLVNGSLCSYLLNSYCVLCNRMHY